MKLLSPKLMPDVYKRQGKAYYAVFNYMDQELQMTTALERLGLNTA